MDVVSGSRLCSYVRCYTSDVKRALCIPVFLDFTSRYLGNSEVNMLLNVHRNHKAYVEEGWWGVMEVVEEGNSEEDRG